VPLHLTQCGLGRDIHTYQVASSRLATRDMGRKLRAVPLWERWVPFNIMWPGRRPTTILSGILIHPFGHNTWAKIREGCCRFFWAARTAYYLLQCRLGRGIYLPTKWHRDPSSRLAPTDMAENWGLCAHLFEGWVPM